MSEEKKLSIAEINADLDNIFSRIKDKFPGKIAIPADDEWADPSYDIYDSQGGTEDE